MPKESEGQTRLDSSVTSPAIEDDGIVTTICSKSTLQKAFTQASSVDAASKSMALRRAFSAEYQPNYLKHVIFLKAFELAQSQRWENFNLFILCLKAIEMGFYFHFDDEWYESYFLLMDIAFVLVFLFETVVKFMAFGHHVFFNFWYSLCAFCTAAAVGDMIYRTTPLGREFKITSKFLNSIRLLMLGNLLRAHPETRLIVLSMLRSLKALRGVLIVIIVVLYGCTLGVYAVVGQADEYKERKIQFNDQEHEVYFGTIPKTMLTMFSMLILSEWENFVRPIYDVQPYFVMFFVCFTMLLTFGLMNVLVGIIVGTVTRIHQEHEAVRKQRSLAKQQNRLVEIVDQIFGDDEEINQEDFFTHVNRVPEIFNILQGFHVPDHFTFEDLFTILDGDQDGSISKDELSDGLTSFLAGNENARFCLLQLNISKTHRDIYDIKQMLADMTGRKTKQMRSSDSDLPYRSPRSDLPTVSSDNRNSAGSYLIGSAPLGNSSLPNKKVVHPVAAANAAGVDTTTNSVSNHSTTDNSDLWGQCYSSLRTTVEKHCKLELVSSWERLQTWYDNVNHGPAPTAGLQPGSSDLKDQEDFMIWRKLHQAVCNESEIELKNAVDHATSAGIDSSRLALELIYKEALKYSRGVTLPISEVQGAITKGDWSSSFGMVLECALANGADKHILSHVIARVSQDSGVVPSCTDDVSRIATGRPLVARREGSPDKSDNMNASPISRRAVHPGAGDAIPDGAPTSPSSFVSSERVVQGRAAGVRKFGAIKTKVGSDSKAENMQEHVLTILHTEAFQHCTDQKRRAWQTLQLRDLDDLANAPLSESEELFFVYSHICNAVERKSFADLQRALTQAIVAGFDMRSLEVEVAYRDALSRCYTDSAHSIRLAVDAFKRKEWYLALDLLIQVSLDRGADKQSLLRVLTKIFAETRGH